MAKVVVVGGGFAGCAAALSAAKAGADVTLVERTDELLGTGRAGSLYRNNGRFVGAEEMIAMGGGDIIEIFDRIARHKNLDGLPGHNHLWLFDVFKVEPLCLEALLNAGVKVELQTRMVNTEVANGKISSIIVLDTPLTVIRPERRKIEGDVFIDTTGGTGSEGNCRRYGNGCSMCVLRCPTFGPRESLAAKAGVQEKMSPKEYPEGSFGAFSGACEIHLDSLSPELKRKLVEEGVVKIPLKEELVRLMQTKMAIKACQQYALPEFATNLLIVDNGYAKIVTPFMPISALRSLPGFEKAHFVDPCSGGIGNSVRWLAITPRDNTLKVDGVANLFCAGEKAFVLGHTEAIATGGLAGHNAARMALGKNPLELPRTTVVGDIIAYAGEFLTEEQLPTRIRPTFSGGPYFKRMEDLGLYTTDVEKIKERIERVGLTGIFAQKLH